MHDFVINQIRMSSVVRLIDAHELQEYDGLPASVIGIHFKQDVFGNYSRDLTHRMTVFLGRLLAAGASLVFQLALKVKAADKVAQTFFCNAVAFILSLALVASLLRSANYHFELRRFGFMLESMWQERGVLFMRATS